MNNYPFPGARLDQESAAVSMSDGKTDVHSEHLKNSVASSSIQLTHKTRQHLQKRAVPSKKPPIQNHGKTAQEKRSLQR